MGTKEAPGEPDCYAEARPNEPIFILLGRDRHAPVLVRLWALLRHREGEDGVIVDGALDIANAMGDYFNGIKPDKMPMNTKLANDLLLLATVSMPDHPDGYDGTCDCDTCRSYR